MHEFKVVFAEKYEPENPDVKTDKLFGTIAGYKSKAEERTL